MSLQTFIASLSIILFLGTINCSAQNITINTKRAKEIYQVNSSIIKTKEVKDRISVDEAAWKKFVSGQRWNIGGIATCAGGGVVLLTGIGYAIDYSVNYEVLDASEKVDESLAWKLVGAGIGALVPGAIMILHGRNQRINAVKSFNQTAKDSSYRTKLQLRPASRGIGLSLVF